MARRFYLYKSRTREQKYGEIDTTDVWKRVVVSEICIYATDRVSSIERADPAAARVGPLLCEQRRLPEGTQRGRLRGYGLPNYGFVFLTKGSFQSGEVHSNVEAPSVSSVMVSTDHGNDISDLQDGRKSSCVCPVVCSASAPGPFLLQISPRFHTTTRD